MGYGYSKLYPSLSPGGSSLKGGMTYNSAGSSEVGTVSSGKIVGMGEKVPTTSTPNSVVQKRNGDKIIVERYYNEKGEPYLDIDYTDHGNPKRHPIVPHKHAIKYENGEFDREEPGKAIK